jgi:hypothetical protein
MVPSRLPLPPSNLLAGSVVSNALSFDARVCSADENTHTHRKMTGSDKTDPTTRFEGGDGKRLCVLPKMRGKI